MLKIIKIEKNPKEKQQTFADLNIGDTFDFISPRTDLNSFYDRCIKISKRKYKSLVTGHEFSVGSVRAKVYHSGITANKNPKRKKKVICARKNPFVATKTKKNAVRKARILIANAEKDLHRKLSNGQRTDLLMDNMPVSHSQAMAIVDHIRKPNKRDIKARRKIIRAKRNPPRKRHETIITGLVRVHGKKFKRVYFTGTQFSNDARKAKLYSGDGARLEARRILPLLPYTIERIYVEKAPAERIAQ